MKRVFINIRASKNISVLVNVSVTSPAGLMKFFLNVEPCTRKLKFLRTIQTLSCWYPLESSRQVLSDEYPFARFSVIFQLLFFHRFALAKLVTSSIQVNAFLLPYKREKEMEKSRCNMK